MTKINPKTAEGQSLATVQSGGALANLREVPEHLRAHMEGDRSTELLKKYVVPPRIKVIQPSAQAPFSDRFKRGDVIALPTMQLMASHGNENLPAFTFTPVMMFPEWTCVNPIETKGTLKMIRERSFDAKSELACRARDPKVRKDHFPCPEMPKKGAKDLFLRYVANLNYIIIIHGDHPFSNMPISITYASAEHQTGTTFNGLISMRKCPLYGCNFQAVIRRRTNEIGEWYGIDPENPGVESGIVPWVDVETTVKYKALHEEFLRLYEEKLIQVDYDEKVDEVVAPRDAKDM